VWVSAQLNTDDRRKSLPDKLLAAITLAPAILVSTANDINAAKLPSGGAALPP